MICHDQTDFRAITNLTKMLIVEKLARFDRKFGVALEGGGLVNSPYEIVYANDCEKLIFSFYFLGTVEVPFYFPKEIYEGLLIYQERMEGNENLLNKSEYGSGRTGCNTSDETRLKMSEANSGGNHPQFKGLVIGTNRNNQLIVFCGGVDMKSRGFNSGHISRVINGNRPHHKKFTFIRTSDVDQLKTILGTADFIDEISRQRIEEFIQE